MAASPIQPHDLTTVDLRELRARQLRPLLDAQTEYWSARYYWDFTPSKNVILRFIEAQSLYGHALLQSGQVIGYSYFVHEGSKALVGDLFISESHRHEAAERFLLYQTLASASVFPGVRRIEGQLLALAFDPSDEVVFGRRLDVFRRRFMLKEGLALLPGPHPAMQSMRFRPWSDTDLDAAAELLASAYENHVDALINDQYRGAAGARRFLYNSTQHPGCGTFFRRAALTAVDPLSECLAGMCLGSLVQSKVGHITQLCVAPEMRAKGLGYELLRRALRAYREHGCQAVSLTVTSSNRGAVELYERLEFHTIREFPAFVWETS